jgi:zinc/manganese transport system substrate-binding protein
MRRMPRRAALASVAVLAAAGAGCGLVSAPRATAGDGPATAAAASPTTGKIACVAAENEYADVISQVGGRYVSTYAVISNPNTDPHELEASPAVTREVSSARLVVQNGVGYDTFMDKVEAATPHRGRMVVVAQHLLSISSNAFNPHLWYDPRTMPAVAAAVATDLARVAPSHGAYFRANERAFDRSLRRWTDALATFRRDHPGTPVAVTEPVADYMLQAAGARVLTPRTLQSAVMNGTDPSPQDIATQYSLLRRHRVKALLYNRQVTDSVTAGFLAAARRAHVPVVAVYETMPTPGYNYQSWMEAELAALQRAVTRGAPTVKL